LLDESAWAYAGYATQLLFERHPPARERFAPTAFESWRAQLSQRVQELAVAVQWETPELFASSVAWTRSAFASRDVPDVDLRHSLVCLADILDSELPDASRPLVHEPFVRADAVFSDPVATMQPLDAESPHAVLALSYLEACLAGRPHDAVDLVLAEVDRGLSPSIAYRDVLAAVQVEIGRMWHTGTLDIYEEHVVTAATRDLMVLLAQKMPRASSTGRTVVGAGLEHNAHDLGLRIITDAFQVAGWRTIFLGTDLPPVSMADAARDFDADIVLLSVTMPLQLRYAPRTIAAIRRAAPRARIVVGGLAFASTPDLWRRVGADGFAHGPHDVVAVATSLLSH